ncbi:MAG: tRNA (adenosine(37)-N6)-dimethylallyltransferase MiaA [Candidatus Staskawiczbacteria bacterium]|nr:tRNA (adenosine(37)-N6)-dimethylallyltransferase MiaA [Candidatus Staskawiczbacteria bacterium]
MKTLPKLVVILGPTASGKTDLSIKLAKKLGGQVVSADSRQLYKGLDIGSGKITKKEMAGIPHHLLNVASPKRKFTVSQYQKLALLAIKKIHKNNKIPFLVGGSGFYIKSVIDKNIIPEVRPDWKLRKKLEQKNNKDLLATLLKIDPKRASSIDKNNPRRLIRALEIVLKTGTAVPVLSHAEEPKFDILQIGIKKSPKELKKLIRQRLLKEFENGLITEVKKLKTSGISFKRLEELGLEYSFVAQYLQKKLPYREMLKKLQKEIEHFSKRQITWFKRDKRIKWVKNYKEAENLVKNFLD